MFKIFDATAEMPSVPYRTPREVRRDISVIKEKIKDVNERLNMRTLLMDMLSDEGTVNNPNSWIPELTEALEVARQSQMTLLSLEKELRELCAELKESRWVHGN